MANGKMGGPRKHADATTTTSVDAFKSDDEVVALTAVRDRLAEMLARPDVLERDMAALNKDYRKVIVELKEARLRADSAELGTRRGLKAVRGFDDCI